MKSGTASVNTDSKACFARATRVWLVCDSLSITTPVSLLANEFAVRSVFHGQVCLAAFNQIHVFHKAMNDCQNLKIH